MYKDVILVKGNKLLPLSIESKFYKEIKDIISRAKLSVEVIESNESKMDLDNLSDRISNGTKFILFSRGDKYIMELYKAKAKPEQIIVVGGRSKFATDQDVGLYIKHPDDMTMYGDLSKNSLQMHFKLTDKMKELLYKHLKDGE